MGCVASSFVADDPDGDRSNNGGITHIVSLTSTTYGLLTLDSPYTKAPDKLGSKTSSGSTGNLMSPLDGETAPTVSDRPFRPQPEVINAWELMEGLDNTFEGNANWPEEEREEEEEEEDQQQQQKKKACSVMGGENAVVFYSTTLGGVRKTFEECNRVRAVLEGLGVVVSERDISMHSAYREELRRVVVVAGKEKEGSSVLVPRVFIKGVDVGGMEEVVRMHEEGRLAEWVVGLPKAPPAGEVCDGCGGARFLPCFECSGSRKLVVDRWKMPLRCPECNENGLVLCPFCC